MPKFILLIVATLLYPLFASANGAQLNSLKNKQPVKITTVNGKTPPVMSSSSGRCVMRLNEDLAVNESFELLSQESLQVVGVNSTSSPPATGPFKNSTDPARQHHSLIFNLRNRSGKNLNMICDGVSEAELKVPATIIASNFMNALQTSSSAVNYPAQVAANSRQPAVVPHLESNKAHGEMVQPNFDSRLFNPASYNRVGQ